MQYYLHACSNGAISAGIAFDDTLPSGAIACTQAQYANADAWTVSNGVILAKEQTLAQSLSAISAARYTCETQGILFLPTGSTTSYLAPTDRASQQKMTCSFMMASGGYWDENTKWFFANNTAVALTKQDVIRLCIEAQAYIQQCYINQATLNQIASSGGTLDLTAGWPNRGQSDGFTMTADKTSCTKGETLTLTLTPNQCGPLADITLTLGLTTGSSAGDFSSTTLTFPSQSTAPVTATFTPSEVGTATISVVNSTSLTNPSNVTVVVSA